MKYLPLILTLPLLGCSGQAQDIHEHTHVTHTTEVTEVITEPEPEYVEVPAECTDGRNTLELPGHTAAEITTRVVILQDQDFFQDLDNEVIAIGPPLATDGLAVLLCVPEAIYTWLVPEDMLQ